MNRTVKTTAVFLFVCSMFAMAQTAQAQALSISTKDVSPTVAVASTPFLNIPKVETAESQTKAEPVSTEAPRPIEYNVQPGDSLSIIAAKYQTTWKRLFDKNTAIAIPDVITVNEHLVIPAADEVLAERVIPAAGPVEAPQPTRVTSAASRPKTTSYPSGSSGGNTYTRGYCTWYAKNRRPDLPNNLGNAITWVSRAAAQGLPTGSAPRVGAIGQSGNHVVYVESVNGDGTITVSEMNWEGVGVISSRTTSAGAFSYVY